jgi:hypothetical protein
VPHWVSRAGAVSGLQPVAAWIIFEDAARRRLTVSMPILREDLKVRPTTEVKSEIRLQKRKIRSLLLTQQAKCKPF